MVLRARSGDSSAVKKFRGSENGGPRPVLNLRWITTGTGHPAAPAKRDQCGREPKAHFPLPSRCHPTNGEAASYVFRRATMLLKSIVKFIASQITPILRIGAHLAEMVFRLGLVIVPRVKSRAVARS
jgi:hypothetical protein